LEDAPGFSFGLPVDEGGRVAERQVPLGKYRVQITIPGAATAHATIEVDGTGRCSPAVVRVRPGRRIVGCVTDRSGRPVADCFVQFANLRAKCTPQGRTSTDTDGRFTLSGAKGVCSFHFQARGFAHAGCLRWIPSWVPWRHRMNVALSRGCVVRGVVRDEHGEPVPQAFVHLRSHGRGPMPVCGYSAWTDAAGRFEQRDLPLGPISVTCLGVEQRLSCDDGGQVDIELRVSSAAARAWA
jgi:hypothetical protein